MEQNPYESPREAGYAVPGYKAATKFGKAALVGCVVALAIWAAVLIVGVTVDHLRWQFSF